jgi:hypothetical protein
MGIDFSHCNAQWSYGGFHSFRTRLASEIGMDLRSMEGFGGDKKFSDFKDDIIPLLNHSDCDGELSPEECKKVAPRLRELVKDWPDGYDKRRALELAEGMELAVSKNEHLQFC